MCGCIDVWIRTFKLKQCFTLNLLLVSVWRGSSTLIPWQWIQCLNKFKSIKCKCFQFKRTPLCCIFECTLISVGFCASQKASIIIDPSRKTLRRDSKNRCVQSNEQKMDCQRKSFTSSLCSASTLSPTELREWSHLVFISFLLDHHKTSTRSTTTSTSGTSSGSQKIHMGRKAEESGESLGVQKYARCTKFKIP